MDYETKLRTRIDSLVPTSETFLELCSNAEGVFPAVALDALRRINAERGSAKLEHLIKTAVCQTSEAPRWSTNPENLIIDFDWRFQKDTAERLFGMLSRFSSVVCVGAPTVFSLLSAVRGTDILIDQNPYYERAQSINGGKIFCSAIEDFDCRDLEGRFEAALLDPPWNLEDYRSWLQATLPMVVIGGSLFIPIFPNLLRESVDLDLWHLKQVLADIGQASTLPFKVRYDTPTFEEQVLRRSGLPPLHGWRSAEMVEIRVDRPLRCPAKRKPVKERWDRFEFGRTVVAVRTNRSASNDATQGRFFFLDSVSNRHDARRGITAVSSKNVATDFQNISLIKETLRSLPGGLRFDGHADPLVLVSQRLGASHG